ncbi:ribose-phosphate pyrophosphokinase [bacterium]|nr:ribose-phosphate pyrophosphokinase [bacterium]
MTPINDKSTELRVFSGTANQPLAEKIASHLGLMIGKISLTRFPDGEIAVKIEEDVRGRDIFIVQPTCPPVNENLMELLTMLDAFRRASAQRITAVVPYYGYARQDRKDEGRVPITAKLVANLISKAGADRVLSMDLHAAQIQGFFDVPVDHLYSVPVIQAHFSHYVDPKDLVIVSPDVGRIKLAQKFVNRLGGDLVIIDKRRKSSVETVQENVIGASVEGKTAILVDDMISTGGSIAGAARTLKRFGATKILVGATHGIFCGRAVEILSDAPIDEIVVTDTIPVDEARRKLGVVTKTVAHVLAEAIRRIHNSESVSYLFDTVIGDDD